MFDSRLSSQLLTRQQNCQSVLGELRTKLSSKLIEILKQCEKAESSSEVFMANFEQFSSLPSSSSDKNFTVIDLNLNLRISHLLFLARLAASKVCRNCLN
jgi:hypothetical protein